MSEKIAPVDDELAQNDTYGTAVTAKGLQLIAKIIATKANLTIVKVMMGSGSPLEGTYIGDLEDLVEPVAEGTVSEPFYSGSTVEMTVEYRSDMNGGLQEGFIIREFGIFAKDPDAEDGGEIMILYGNLSKYPQYIAPYTGGGLDIRRYPVSITVAEGTTVILDGLPSTVVTMDDIKDYCVTTLLPQLLTSSKAQIDTHNKDKNAHPDIRQAIEDVKTDLTGDIEAAKEELSGQLKAAKEELAKDLASSAGGFAAKITFQEGCVGWNYKITDGADETYTGIVPDNLVVEVVLHKCSTEYTVTAWDGQGHTWSNSFTTGPYFGSMESKLTDFDAALTVTTAPYAKVTAVCGEQSYIAVASGEGTAELKIGVAGRYTVTAELDGKTVSGYVTISESQSYSLSLLDFRVDINAKPMSRGYIVFEPEEWDENELRISQVVHGLDPVSESCVCSVRQRIGRNVRELTEADVETVADAIVEAMKEALSANSAADQDPKPYPPADDGHIPFTWEQVQYYLLEDILASSSEAEAKAAELGFGVWKERNNGVTTETTLEQLLTAAYLPALDGADTNYKKVCTLEAIQGLRFRVEGSGKGYVPVNGQGYAAKYDMDGILTTTWGTMGSRASLDLETKDLVLQADGPYAGDVLVIG